MNERIEVLRRLQAIDTKLKRMEGDKLYRNNDANKKQRHIQQKKDAFSKLGDEIKSFQKNTGVKEVELKSLEAEINKLRLQMNQVKNNKEYNAIKTEIAGKEADKSVFEEEILRMMTGFEELQQRHKALGKEIEHEESLMKELLAQIGADLKKLDAEIAGQKTKRNEYAAKLDQEALQQYNRLVSHKDAVAIVSVVNRVCQGCFMAITSQTLNQLLSEKELTFCHSCGRILYLEHT